MMYPTRTVYQPWASLIAIGAKPFETNDRPPPAKHIGKRIAIQAAVRPIQATWRKLDPYTRRAISAAFKAAGIDAFSTEDLRDLPHGAVVCTAVLSAAYHLEDCGTVIEERRPFSTSIGYSPRQTISIDPFGDYSPGRWAWLLTDVEPLAEPMPAKGKQGWWTWRERGETDIDQMGRAEG